MTDERDFGFTDEDRKAVAECIEYYTKMIEK